MPIERAPSKPLPAGFKPAGGRTYRIQDGDSWWTLAIREGVLVWDLIEYNFATRVPAEVNWYMKRRLGCDQVTPNRKNYRFSSSAKPGILYLPPKAAAKLAPRPAPPVLKPAPPPLKYGSLGIRLKGSEDEQRAAKAVLDWLAASESGRILLTAIGRTRKTMTIRPFDLDGASCTAANRNAYAAAEDLDDATMKGEYYYQHDDPNTTRDERFDPVMTHSLLKDLLGLPQEPLAGTGAGSDVTVSFTPKMWGFGNICSATGGQPGSSPSQVLFHEMVHGFRMMRGHFRGPPTLGSSRRYDNEEEFFAVVLSNIYIADPTNSTANRTLRADHWGFTPLATVQNTTAGFLAVRTNRARLEIFAREEPDLASKLKTVGGPFNPFTGL